MIKALQILPRSKPGHLMTDPKEEIGQNEEMSFVGHLDSLRKHLIRGIIAVFILAIVAFFFKDFIFNELLFGPKEKDFITNRLLCQFGGLINIEAICINQNKIDLINYELAGQFRAHLLVSLIAGIIVGFPFLVWELWRFIRPALKRRERRYSRGLIFATSMLFNIGVLFGYFVIVPLTINFLSNYEVSTQLDDMFNFRNYISIITTVTLSTGLVFELPVLIYFTSKMGLVTPATLKKRRKHAFVLILILSGIITPPDVFSQILVAIPLYLLYEMSISISKRVYRKYQEELVG